MRPLFETREIYPGAWQIRYAFTDREHVFCYLVEGKRCALAIDTMFGYGDLPECLRTLTDKPILLVNTHAHPDHVGGNFAFDHCFIHPLDMPQLYAYTPDTADGMRAQALAIAKEEYRQAVEEAVYVPARPIRTYPVFDGDIFDLGDLYIQVLGMGGHTRGSVVLLDRENRALFTGDAVNANTLLDFPGAYPVEDYMGNLLHLREYMVYFDVMYGGHQVLEPQVVNEGIELCARVLAGTDDAEKRPGMFGSMTTYAARHTADGFGGASQRFAREDGKTFNMSYNPERRFHEPEHGRFITPGHPGGR